MIYCFPQKCKCFSLKNKNISTAHISTGKERSGLMNIGLLGLGTVGGGVYEMLEKRNDMHVKYVLCLEEPQGMRAILTRDLDRILDDPEVDAVVELMGGLHPAREYVIRAMQAGKNIVTANKLLIAECYEELTQLAIEKDVIVRCTAAAGGGIPWLTAIARCNRVDTITSIYGIMNGTTNFILDTMHQKKVDFDAILRQAQQLGYAERDPSADIDGHDIRNKLVISSNVAFGISLPPEEVDVFGIRNIRQEDVAEFLRRGLCCKLIASSDRIGKAVSAFVEPTLVPKESPEAAVHANFNMICYDAVYAGRQSFYGQGAGRYPTAYNVVEDLLDLNKGEASFYADRADPIHLSNELPLHRYYVRTTAKDDWLEEMTDERWASGVVTKPLPVKRMHEWARESEDQGLFFAAIR